MNEIQIFNNPLCDEIKEMEKSLKDTYLGIVYFLEYGNLLKIGFTNRPYQRMGSLKRSAVNYADLPISRVAIGFKGTNYRKIENAFHKKLHEYRKAGTELFDISLEDAISTSIDVAPEDKSEEIRSQANAFKNRMAGFIFGNTDINGR